MFGVQGFEILVACVGFRDSRFSSQVSGSGIRHSFFGVRFYFDEVLRFVSRFAVFGCRVLSHRERVRKEAGRRNPPNPKTRISELSHRERVRKDGFENTWSMWARDKNFVDVGAVMVSGSEIRVSVLECTSFEGFGSRDSGFGFLFRFQGFEIRSSAFGFRDSTLDFGRWGVPGRCGHGDGFGFRHSVFGFQCLALLRSCGRGEGFGFRDSGSGLGVGVHFVDGFGFRHSIFVGIYPVDVGALGAPISDGVRVAWLHQQHPLFWFQYLRVRISHGVAQYPLLWCSWFMVRVLHTLLVLASRTTSLRA